MELQTACTIITAAEPLGTSVQEQGIELDYVLPDYYPDVFTLIKCFVTPTIVSQSVSGDRLSYELRADIRILYCTEQSHVLQSVTQTLHFSRTAELPPGESITAELTPMLDYVNCRVVSRRRLDVRGAVTVRIRTSAVRRQEVISDITGKGIQLRRQPVQFPDRSIRAERSVLLSEEIELGNAKPPMLHIVRCEPQAVEQSHRFVSGKLMVQGNLQVQLLYACEKDGDGSLEPLSFRLPYSQLIEIEGAGEGDLCEAQAAVLTCDIKPVSDADGEVHALRCEAELRVTCTALHITTESLVTDAFSTEHPSEAIRAVLPLSGVPVPISETLTAAAKLPCTDTELDCVYDAWCEVRTLSTEQRDGSIFVSGMLACMCLVRESSGMPRLLEKEEPFEYSFTPETLGADDMLRLQASASNTAYTLSSAAEVTLRSEISLTGTLTRCTTVEALTGLELSEEEALPRRYALKLYYGSTGEAVWDIARRSHTSVEAIMAENDLTDEVLTRSGMLLIPIVG